MSKRSVPGYPSQVGSKPGDDFISTIQLVASRGLGGSNPPPGAYGEPDFGFFHHVILPKGQTRKFISFSAQYYSEGKSQSLSISKPQKSR